MSAEHHKGDHAHFKGKEAMGHVAEVQAQGILSAAEVHGTEIPGSVAAGADAARETALALLLAWTLLYAGRVSFTDTIFMLIAFASGWTLWKFGRGAWLGWTRLERLHRVLEQEKWEIEHHRPQEREELRVLYSAKGFEGKLLEEVVDVLMADDSRLLRVMVEEEMGISLETHEHPLKQGLGALIGSVSAGVICLIALVLFGPLGIVVGALFAMAVAGVISAWFAQNRWIPAIVWNVGLGIMAFGSVYFLIEYLSFIR